MKISFENPDKINGLLTLVVEEEDYKNDVEKTLKDYRKKANVPGFRPGQAPMGMIKRQFGPSVKMEAINKLVGQQIYKYVQDNNIQMLGEPLPSENFRQNEVTCRVHSHDIKGINLLGDTHCSQLRSDIRAHFACENQTHYT
jgi:FKBP-type peptidyl-prolyl cis-trans isomerase (trigger factor)